VLLYLEKILYYSLKKKARKKRKGKIKKLRSNIGGIND
jgi:hypothetical protein